MKGVGEDLIAQKTSGIIQNNVIQTKLVLQHGHVTTLQSGDGHKSLTQFPSCAYKVGKNRSPVKVEL